MRQEWRFRLGSNGFQALSVNELTKFTGELKQFSSSLAGREERAVLGDEAF